MLCPTDVFTADHITLYSCRMINRNVIKELYSKYSKPPRSIDELDFAALSDCVGELHGIRIDVVSNTVAFGSLPADSPFASVPLTHIHGIVAFDDWVAVVLRSAILFLCRREPKVSVDIKAVRRPLFGRW